MVIGFLFAIAASATWGLVYVLEQIMLVELSVPKLLILEGLFVGILALVFSLISGKPEYMLSAADLKMFLRPSFLLLLTVTILADYFILKSVQGIGASFAGLFEISFPVFIVLFAFIILRQPIHWTTAVGGSLIMLGSSIVIYFNRL